jgi:serine/threonine protein kinase/Tol biopolymer transport system component
MTPGSRIAHYEVVDQLGEGGMGVVLKARDTKLDRLVALKVMPTGRLVDDQDRRRFVQEAKAASALNQPNIVTIYEINEWEGGQYIAMEYVQGKNLHDLTRERGLTVLEALRYSVQIATALSAAHEAGITHRDLKPANIMVTDKGVVKVLDFGLAKLNRGPEQSESMPTLSIRADDAPYTAKGTVVGTYAYMSPEQAKGQVVDTRSDIFSFGAVLYEMVTGKRAFRGHSAISTMSAILHLEPEPPSLVMPGVPRDVERIINRCLRKEREKRFQSMTDVKLELLDLEEETTAGKLLVRADDLASLASQPGALKTMSRAEAEQLISRISTAAAIEPPIPRRKVVRAGVLALAAIAAALVGAWRLGLVGPDTAPPPPAVRLTTDPGLSTDPALSPDGRLVVYASDRAGRGNLSLWMRNLSGGEPAQLTSGPYDDYQPSFSPDGANIVFRSDRDGGGIYVVAALGGEPRPVARHGRNPRYSPDGKHIAYWVGELQAAAQLYVAPAGGGSSRPLAFKPVVQARVPVWSPDGEHILFIGREAGQVGQIDWWVGPAGGGTAVRTGAFDVISKAGLRVSYSTVPRDWTPDGVYFSAGGAPAGGRDPVAANIVNPNDSANVWRIPLSRSHKAYGEPRRLTFTTGLDNSFSIAPAGAGMVFASLSGSVNIWSLPAPPRGGEITADPKPLTTGTAVDSYPSITADGKRMVFWSDRSGNGDIWLKELDTGKEIRLTVDPARETFPVIAPDGSAVAWAVMDDPKYPSINLMKLGPGSRPGPVERICSACGNLSDLSSDGRVLYYNDPTGGVVLLNAATGETSRIARRDNQHMADPRFSPDGKWIGYHVIVDEAARQIQIAPAPDVDPQGDRIAITAGRSMDRLAAWSPDGGTLYFISEADGFRCIAARRLDRATRRPEGPVFFVYHSHQARRSIMNLANINMARLAIGRDRIIVSLGERTGNLWTAPLP